MPPHTDKPNPTVRRASSLGWAASFLIHALLVILLLIVWFPVGPDPGLIVSARFGAHGSGEGASRISNKPGARIAGSPEEVTGDLLEKKIRNLITEQSGQSRDRQIHRLEQASKRLERFSSADSIDKMADQFHNWLALSPRAYEPVPSAAEGEFDLDSAQVHDVTQYVDEMGAVKYMLVLLDAAGRTFELELDDETGKEVYELMQRFKEHPLLDKVYRRIVMPLLDRLIHEKNEEE